MGCCCNKCRALIRWFDNPATVPSGWELIDNGLKSTGVQASAAIFPSLSPFRQRPYRWLLDNHDFNDGDFGYALSFTVDAEDADAFGILILDSEEVVGLGIGEGYIKPYYNNSNNFLSAHADAVAITFPVDVRVTFRKYPESAFPAYVTAGVEVDGVEAFRLILTGRADYEPKPVIYFGYPASDRATLPTTDIEFSKFQIDLIEFETFGCGGTGPLAQSETLRFPSSMTSLVLSGAADSNIDGTWSPTGAGADVYDHPFANRSISGSSPLTTIGAWARYGPTTPLHGLGMTAVDSDITPTGFVGGNGYMSIDLNLVFSSIEGVARFRFIFPTAEFELGNPLVFSAADVYRYREDVTEANFLSYYSTYFGSSWTLQITGGSGP